MDCSCEMCVNCCKASPCCGTPRDIARIALSPFAEKLKPTKVYDAITGKFIESVQLEGEPYEFNGHKLSKCSMLDENGRCKLHYLGLKPTEGKIIDHTFTHQQTVDVRHSIMKSWEGFAI